MLQKIIMSLVFLCLAGFASPSYALDPPLTPLMAAAKSGDVTTLNALLQQGADINALTRKNTTALYYAVRGGHLEAVKALLAAGAPVNRPDAAPLLAIATRKGFEEIVYLMLANGADVNYLGTGNAPALYAAVFDRETINLDLIKELIERGADVNHTDIHFKKTPLMIAVDNGRLDVAQLLIDAGADITAASITGRTALFYAAGTMHGDRIKSLNFLLERGADPMVQNDKGQDIAAFIEDLSLSYKIEKAEAGDGFDQYKLANEYRKYPRAIFSQEKVNQTFAWARDTLERLANDGDAKATYTVGYIEFFGQDGDKKTDSGLAWMIKAGEAGYRNAQWKLGYIYANGKGGITVDKQKAIHWYELAAAQGSNSSKKALEKLKSE